MDSQADILEKNIRYNAEFDQELDTDPPPPWVRMMHKMCFKQISIWHIILRMDLHAKIKKIEALIAGAKSDGGRQAAALARNRILERVQEEKATQPIEYTVPLGNPWKKKLFVALCNKHNLRTYRYKRQKYTTTMLRACPTFVDNVLWPEFKKYSTLLEELVQEIIDDLISQIHDIKEEEVVITGELLSTMESVAL